MDNIYLGIQLLTLAVVVGSIIFDVKIWKKRDNLRELDMAFFKKQYEIREMSTKKEINQLLQDKERSEKVINELTNFTVHAFVAMKSGYMEIYKEEPLKLEKNIKEVDSHLNQWFPSYSFEILKLVRENL